MKNEAAREHLIACFADALQKSMTVERGGQWLCATSAAAGHSDATIKDRESLAMKIRLRGTLHGELVIEVAQRDADSLLALGGSEGIREAWQQVMASLVKRLPKRSADTDTFAFSVESCGMVESSGCPIQIGRLELGETGQPPCVLDLLADDELIESFQVAEWTASPAGARANTQEIIAPELGRVIDVPLTVTLRFGQRTMRLRDVLELNTGALVELDRQVEEPVDLILGERVIARGEVVIVDGNYGLRVTEIVERPQAAML